MASPVAIATFSWQGPPSPLPPGASAVDHYDLIVLDVLSRGVFSKSGIPASQTSYTTTAADNLALSGSGCPYTLSVWAVDANGKKSLTPGSVQFEAVPPVFTPPVPQGVVVSQITWQ